MNEPTPLLSTSALTIGYTERSQPKRIVAESLTVQLQPGQLVCLLGPNGGGKSTLMRTLAGLQPPLRGYVTLLGQSLVTLHPVALAQKLSLVLSERIESGTMLVRELVALGRTPYTNWLGNLTAHDLDVVQNALRLTDTLAYVDRRVSQLSDGERQKVMLARALAQDTEVILMDEPTAHLDLPNRVEMMRLLHQLTRQTGKAILLSTHELDLALQAADQLWLLSGRGDLVTGAPEDLVLTGAFEATFAKNGFSFDRATGTFTMHTEPTGPLIGLVGDEQLLFWTRRALQREGFTVSSPAEAICCVEAIQASHGLQWQYSSQGHPYSFHSIAELLRSLRRLQPYPNAAIYHD